MQLQIDDDLIQAVLDARERQRKVYRERCAELRCELSNVYQAVPSPQMDDLSHLYREEREKEEEKRYREYGKKLDRIRLPLLQEYDEVVNQYNKLVSDLRKMDQLFIAVGGGGKGQ
jgi:hypothetical protein